jgi:hypothetical protein
LNCPEIPACTCPVCPTCIFPEETKCPDCNCPQPEKCPQCKAEVPDVPKVPDVKEKPYRETEEVDTLESSNNLFSNFYAFFSKDADGDLPVISHGNTKSEEVGLGMDGFEAVPGHAAVPER